MTNSELELRNWDFAVFYSKSREFRSLDEKVLEFILNPEKFIQDIKSQFNDEE